MGETQHDTGAHLAWPEGWPYRWCTGCQYQYRFTIGTVLETRKLQLTRESQATQLLIEAKKNVAALEVKSQFFVS